MNDLDFLHSRPHALGKRVHRLGLATTDGNDEAGMRAALDTSLKYLFYKAIELRVGDPGSHPSRPGTLRHRDRSRGGPVRVHHTARRSEGAGNARNRLPRCLPPVLGGAPLRGGPRTVDELQRLRRGRSGLSAPPSTTGRAPGASRRTHPSTSSCCAITPRILAPSRKCFLCTPRGGE